MIFFGNIQANQGLRHLTMLRDVRATLKWLKMRTALSSKTVIPPMVRLLFAT